jgi:hypothetical protein
MEFCLAEDESDSTGTCGTMVIKKSPSQDPVPMTASLSLREAQPNVIP